MKQSSRMLLALSMTFGGGLVGCGRVVTIESSGDGGAESWSSDVTGSSSGSGSTSVGGVGGGGPGLVEVKLGRHDASGPIPFFVSQGVLGATMVARATDDHASVTFATLGAPSGALVVDGPLPGNHATWKRVGISSMATPQIDHPESFPLAAGTWTFGVETAAPVDVSVWVRKTSDGAFHGGVVDLNVFASSGVTKKKHVLTVAADAFSDFAGLELGDVRFFDLGDGYLEIDEQNLPAALAATAWAPTRPAINVIATRKIGGKYEGSAGYSTGIPGSPMTPGSHESAVVWMVNNDHDLDPLVLRHEAGHFAGLFHTSEFIVGEVDSLDDTPSCDDVMSTYAQCDDFDFTMFPSGGSGKGLFSPKQRSVVQASAIYRGIFTEGQPPMTPYGPPIGGTPTAASGFDWGGKATHEELEDARREAIRFASERAARTRGAIWSRGLAPGLLGLLTGIGCPTDTSDASGALDRLALESPSALLAVSEDPSAPTVVRSRAILALGRAATGLGPSARGSAVKRVADVARDRTAPSALRSFALEAMRKLSREQARSLAIELALDRDALVEKTASEL